MPAMMILPYLAKYWWVLAIVVLLGYSSCQTKRMHSAQAALESSKAEIATMNAQNHDLKATSDDCNAKVEQMKRDGEAWQQRAEAAEQKANDLQVQAVRAAADTMAHPPANDCKSILKYGRDQARAFQW